ncbi:hypothetical protein C8Q74DRAFT_853601 [Fomes fomentarius]|nr:hypothetical protein C8Q74DRAFT_853601 [Fomes fomentarius]
MRWEKMADGEEEEEGEMREAGDDEARTTTTTLAKLSWPPNQTVLPIGRPCSRLLRSTYVYSPRLLTLPAPYQHTKWLLCSSRLSPLICLTNLTYFVAGLGRPPSAPREGRMRSSPHLECALHAIGLGAQSCPVRYARSRMDVLVAATARVGDRHRHASAVLRVVHRGLEASQSLSASSPRTNSVLLPSETGYNSASGSGANSPRVQFSAILFPATRPHSSRDLANESALCVRRQRPPTPAHASC